MMKAAVLHGVGDVRIDDLPKPEIRHPDDVLVNIKSVGVCGSDIHYYTHGRIGDFVVNDPMVLGHESAGIVEAVGTDVKSLVPGDKVALEPGIPCRRCEFCKSGRYNLCPDVRFFATPPVHGTLAEYVVHPADFCFKLPDHISLDEGAMVEPLSVGLHGAMRGNVKPGDHVVVLGAGAIGLSAMQAARSMGAARVICVDLYPFRLDLARKLGADTTVNARETDTVGKIMEVTGGRGVDVVFETAGAAATTQMTVDIARRGGTIIQIGLGEQDVVPLKMLNIIFKELNICGVHRYCNIHPRVIELLDAGRIDARSMITTRFPLDQVEHALKTPVEKPDSTVKVVIEL